MRSGTSSGQPASAASGAGATSSAAATAWWRATASRTSRARHRAVVLDVGRDLDDALPLEAEPERAHAGQPLGPALADAGGDGAGVVERRGRRELEVEGDQRRAGGDERRPRRRVDGARAEVGRELAGGDARGQPSRARRGAAPRGCARRPARRRGRPGCRRRRSPPPRAGPPRRPPPARPRPGTRRARRRGRRRAGAARRGGAGRSRRARPRRPRRAPRRSVPGSPARRKTARWWSASSERCRTAACAAKAAWMRRGPPRRGPRRRWGRRRAGSRVQHEAPALEHAGAADVERRVRGRGSRGGSGTATVPPIPALAPNATCTVPSIFSSSRMLPVRRAFSFVPTPSSAKFVPCSPAACRRPSHASPISPLAPVRRPSSTVRRTGSSGRPSDGERGGHHGPLAAQRRDEPLAAGQVAEGAGRGEVALVGDARAAREVDAQVGAQRAGHVRLAGRREQVGDAPGCARAAARSRRPSGGPACPRSRRAAWRRGRRPPRRPCGRGCARASAGSAR